MASYPLPIHFLKLHKACATIGVPNKIYTILTIARFLRGRTFKKRTRFLGTT